MIINYSNNNYIDFVKKSIKLFTKLFVNWIFVSKKSEITYLIFFNLPSFSKFYILLYSFFSNILSPFIDFQKKQLFLSLDTIAVKNFN